MLILTGFLAAVSLAATFVAASACLDSFAVINPNRIRYQNLNIFVNLTYDATLCDASQVFSATFNRNDGYYPITVDNINISDRSGEVKVDTQVQDYQYPKGVFELVLSQLSTGDTITRSVIFKKQGDFDRCMGQLGFYGQVTAITDGTLDGSITLPFSTDIDFCAGIVSPSSEILIQDPSTYSSNLITVARCGSVDLAPPLDPADPQFYPVVRVECERTGSFYNPNGGATIRFVLESDDPETPAPGVGERSFNLALAPTSAEQACRDGIEYLLPETVLRDSALPFTAAIQYPAICAGMTFQMSTYNVPARYCDEITMSAGSTTGTFTCPWTENDAPFNNNLVGNVNRFLLTEYIQYYPVYRDLPDPVQCGNNLQWYVGDTYLYGGTVDYPSTSQSLFTATVKYPTSGVCDETMFADFELQNSERRYSCSRLVIVAGGEASITCQRRTGTMATNTAWYLRPVVPAVRKRDRLPLSPDSGPFFFVSHNDNPGASGGLRKKSGDGQAGYRVSGGLHCLPGLTACPIPGSRGLWECLDTRSKLDACGGCPYDGGVDCTEIPGANQVACVSGKCQVASCDDKYRLSADTSTCDALEEWEM